MINSKQLEAINMLLRQRTELRSLLRVDPKQLLWVCDDRAFYPSSFSSGGNRLMFGPFLPEILKDFAVMRLASVELELAKLGYTND